MARCVSRMKKKAKVIIASVVGAIVLLPAIAIVGLYLAFKVAFSGDPTEGLSWRHDLPATATDVHEWAWADGFLPDYSYILKAKVSEPDFNVFIRKLKLTPHSPDRQYSDNPAWLSWSCPPGFTNDWWDASGSLSNTFVDEGHDTWSFAKYENGYLYFQSLNH